MRQRLLEFVALLLACASLFALAFASLSSGSVFLILSLGADPRPEQEFVTGLIVLIFVVHAAWIGGLVGAITGALYMMVPRRARDAWMAMAIGAGIALIVSIFDPEGLNWPFIWIAWPGVFVAGPVIFAALASLASAWIIRKWTRAPVWRGDK